MAAVGSRQRAEDGVFQTRHGLSLCSGLVRRLVWTRNVYRDSTRALTIDDIDSAQCAARG